MVKALVEIFTTPAIMLGIVALIGLLLQGKSTSECISGTFKTILGVLILSSGAGVIVQSLGPFSDLFTKAFNLTGVVPFDEAVTGAVIQKIAVVAKTSSLIIAFGFVVNLVLARLTPFKYIFLTGHMIWILAGFLAFALYDLGLSETNIVVVGSLVQGAVLTLLPAIAQPIMRQVTGSNEFGYGHLTTLGVVAGALVGKMVGNPSESSEDLKVPQSLEFFRDTAISISVVMLVIYLVTVLVAGPAAVAKVSQGQSPVTYAVVQALTFTAGVLILLQGVRMFLGEIIPSFRGIALKVVPGAIPALDCPVVFPYAPTALMLGFVSSVIGMIVGMLVSRLFGTVIPLPSIIGGFFTGGTSGIFGNAVGGRRGAIVAGFVYGLILTIPVALFYPLYDLPKYGITGVAMLVPDGLAVLAIIKAVASIF
ncbi:MAG: ascorbate system component [Bacillota bacterium]|nr:ascorbate system component [Bacillota bacterium]MDK2854925.1 ascorbate system component [Bacillota bacterium]MDK2924238.1 ascorbate system component [Bacillota bacterium]